MIFLACTHWTRALLKGSFVLLIKRKMKTKQVIAVIGASGEMGSAIAKTISNENYRVLLQSSDTEKVWSLIDVIRNNKPSADVEVVNHPLDACWEADIIIIAVPYAAEKEVAEIIWKVTNQKIVISVSNPLKNTDTGVATTSGTSAAEELQKLLPHAKVIKAFNTVFVKDFNHPVINGQQVDSFIAGNDHDALDVVYDLVKTAGFNPVIAGDLSQSRMLENMKFLLIQLSKQNNYYGRAGWKLLHD